MLVWLEAEYQPIREYYGKNCYVTALHDLNDEQFNDLIKYGRVRINNMAWYGVSVKGERYVRR